MLAREGLDAGSIVDLFHADPAAVVDLGEGLNDRNEVQLADRGSRMLASC